MKGLLEYPKIIPVESEITRVYFLPFTPFYLKLAPLYFVNFEPALMSAYNPIRNGNFGILNVDGRELPLRQNVKYMLTRNNYFDITLFVNLSTPSYILLTPEPSIDKYQTLLCADYVLTINPNDRTELRLTDYQNLNVVKAYINAYDLNDPNKTLPSDVKMWYKGHYDKPINSMPFESEEHTFSKLIITNNSSLTQYNIKIEGVFVYAEY